MRKARFSDTTPAAPFGRVNVQWQRNAQGLWSANVADAGSATGADYTGEYYPGSLSTNLYDTILALSPLAFWKCSESGTTFADSSGNGHDLTLSGAAVRQSSYLIPTVSDKACLAYPAADNFFYRSGTLGLTMPLGDFTFSVFMGWNRRNTSDGTLFVMRGDPNSESEANNYQALLYAAFDAGMARFKYLHEYSGGTNETAVFAINIEALPAVFHYAVTRNNSTKTLKLYINGKLIDTQTYTNANTGGSGSMNTFLMGASGDTTNGNLYSYAAFWDSVLSASDILSIAQAAGMA